MKRLLALLLAALLLTGCSTDKKDAAKPAPAATAAPTSTPMPPPTGLVRQEPQEYRAISASPDGQVELCAKDWALYIRHGESVIPVTVNESRGVPDTYGNLAKIHSFGAEAAEQVCWSPDGRYITLWSYSLAIMKPWIGGFIFDPHVIDTETGEMYLLDAYETLIVLGHDCATMIDALYSPDGKYLYVLMYGSLGDNRSQVVRYDLSSHESVMLAGFSENMISNSLTLLENGSLLLVQDSDFTTPRQEQSTTLIRLTPKSDGWTTEYFSHTDAANARYCLLSSIAYSQNSHQGLIVTHSQPMREMEDSMNVTFDARAQRATAYSTYPHWPTQQVETDCIVPFQSGNLNSALTTGWWIPSLDAPAALPIPLSQLGDDITADMTGPLPVALYEEGDYYVSSAQIIQAVLSPDGHYALLACRTDAANGRFDGDAALLLLRLSDMTLTRLPGLTGEDVMAAEHLDWCGDTVYLRTSGGEAVTYSVQH